MMHFPSPPASLCPRKCYGNARLHFEGTRRVIFKKIRSDFLYATMYLTKNINEGWNKNPVSKIFVWGGDRFVRLNTIENLWNIWKSKLLSVDGDLPAKRILEYFWR